jgi:hypothetical protein
LQIERRKRKRLVVDDLDCRAAAAEYDTVPKVGSSAKPTISSHAFGRTTMACTITPAIRASGRSVFARARISAVAARTAVAR